MVITQFKSKRKASGGRYKQSRGKRMHETGREPILTRIGDRKVKKVSTKTKNLKLKLLKTDIANLFDPKAKTYSKVKIKTVVDSPSNRHFARRNIITKGTIIETEKGNAKVTSRPGQTGVINAILVTKK